ncbi:hypothetical protein PHLGIDRAFT_18738 [Phlebiopsis gigantea 11061_1 CR5-6]|uniref:Translation initiation factor eIF2B subunit alpha n=1 Tax=Phlebiopsis gigantea (strain 11061_1 CR5-6) TaxID=745531 RepID=A0A0C3NUW5_PHLG1|nr:hypothetical protein PHLGIDRAFT_18738 [Phlebiopsis gigantea 11061_1 CR5-6]
MAVLPLDVYEAYLRILKDPDISQPLAAIGVSTELIQASNAGTTAELVNETFEALSELKRRTPGSVSVQAGCDLFIAFMTLFPHEADTLSALKAELVTQGQKYVAEALSYRDKIAQFTLGFIKDDSVILTHSYSRVVMKALLNAHKTKRISVYVTEARPNGLGLKTYAQLIEAGIPCTVVLDSAVAYVMDKVDFVLVGSEAVVESGGLINAVGSNQMAILAQAARKPFYALAESYKFHRHFPLSQYDLPTHTPSILSFPVLSAGSSDTHDQNSGTSPEVAPGPDDGNSRARQSSQAVPEWRMTAEQISCNPEVDYTRPDLISLVFSDVGILTPEGVSQYLVGMFAG